MLTIEVKEHTRSFFTPLLSFLGQALCMALGGTKVKKTRDQPKATARSSGKSDSAVVCFRATTHRTVGYRIWALAQQLPNQSEASGKSHMVRVPMSHDTPCDLSLTSELLCHFLIDTKAFGFQSALIPYI